MPIVNEQMYMPMLNDNLAPLLGSRGFPSDLSWNAKVAAILQTSCHFPYGDLSTSFSPPSLWTSPLSFNKPLSVMVPSDRFQLPRHGYSTDSNHLSPNVPFLSHNFPNGNSKPQYEAHVNTHFETVCSQCGSVEAGPKELQQHILEAHAPYSPQRGSSNSTIKTENLSSPNEPVTSPISEAYIKFEPETINESSESNPSNLNSSTSPTSTTPTTQRRTPGRPKTYRCKQCPGSQIFMTKEAFWAHQRSVHIREEKLLMCPKCPFVTEYKHHLEYHLRNHFGSKPFRCPTCDYQCVNKSMLNSHMKSHTNVYQYRCSDCSYATKYCHSLKLHLRKHNHRPDTVLNLDGSIAGELDQRTETALSGLKREIRETLGLSQVVNLAAAAAKLERAATSGLPPSSDDVMAVSKIVPPFSL